MSDFHAAEVVIVEQLEAIINAFFGQIAQLRGEHQQNSRHLVALRVPSQHGPAAHNQQQYNF